MATIIPFKGVRYNQAKAGVLSDVITPPYDVIDTAAQNRFYEKNPYNVIRLELGKTFPEDNEAGNRYTRAAATFRDWLDQGVLLHDEKPSLYLYEQEFTARGEKKVRSGFISGVQANDYSKGEVLPHEETLPKHKADRLNMMKTTLANFSPIFGLYADKEHRVEDLLNTARGGRQPDMEVADDNGVLNRLWVISDAAAVEAVVKAMADKKIFIADGHHRYETAVTFGQEMAAQDKPGYNYLMVALVNLYNEGLVVFPTHRLVNNVQDLDVQNLLTGMQKDFSVEELPAGTGLDDFLTRLEQKGASAHAFGLYTRDKKFYLLTLKNEDMLDQLQLENRSAAWRRLDVSILHTLVLENLLGIGSKQRADESNLTYVRDEGVALAAVDNGSAQLVFFMNATKVEEVTDIASGGEKMPQKSTFFYPKVVTGMVINDYER